jgi:hypothetical protein
LLPHADPKWRPIDEGEPISSNDRDEEELKQLKSDRHEML